MPARPDQTAILQVQARPRAHSRKPQRLPVRKRRSMLGSPPIIPATRRAKIRFLERFLHLRALDREFRHQ